MKVRNCTSVGETAQRGGSTAAGVGVGIIEHTNKNIIGSRIRNLPKCPGDTVANIVVGVSRGVERPKEGEVVPQRGM